MGQQARDRWLQPRGASVGHQDGTDSKYGESAAVSCVDGHPAWSGYGDSGRAEQRLEVFAVAQGFSQGAGRWQ